MVTLGFSLSLLDARLPSSFSPLLRHYVRLGFRPICRFALWSTTGANANQDFGGDDDNNKSIALDQLFKLINDAHSGDVTESNGYGSLEH
ncbi:hypothetical protein GW17_00027911 [Ensete ventricosum]|nr:hypothetical protein GW17_00027911 [Ensete ventricosum]